MESFRSRLKGHLLLTKKTAVAALQLAINISITLPFLSFRASLNDNFACLFFVLISLGKLQMPNISLKTKEIKLDS